MTAESMDPREEQIGRILNEYLDRLQRGEKVSEKELLDAHPDLAEELEDHLVTFRQVMSVTSNSGTEPGSPAALPRDALSGYEIQDEIHRGGQGVVYQAVQKATRRKVAIKVMREGPFAGWRDRARFEREVQVLASLNHPSIVTIHDSGIAASCHYFVMDYVTGMPLDVWIGTPRPVGQVLKLFLQICEAINAAHLKGVIHRDLKPGNIRIDDEGRPHILDFGLAKLAMEDDLPEGSRDMTAVGQFVGSLPWTGPEQAQGRLEQIDTRTDVYALGIIFYQMLTGRFPYDVTGPVRDVLNRIVNQEPARPCTIRRDIPKDIEAIVLKCLSKEPHRRYQSAGELARDIQRYLDREPIVARSDNTVYIVGKLLRRYRVPVMVASAFVLLIAASLVASITLWQQAAAQRDRADIEAAQAQQARDIAERERARAEQQAERLRKVSYFNRIALAHNAYEQRYLTQARSILEACPEDLRAWEWGYLYRVSRSPTLLDVVADESCVVSLAISPNGQQVYTGGCDGRIRIWDASSGQPEGELLGHHDQVTALAMSPDGKWLASGGRDKKLLLWELASGQAKPLQENAEYINGLSFSPDSQRLVSGGQDKVLRFWDVAGGELLFETKRHSREVSSVQYSPKGDVVASGELLNLTEGHSKLRLWDAQSGELLSEWIGPEGAILSVAFSRDGRFLACGGGVPPAGGDGEGTLKIIDLQSGLVTHSLEGHGGYVDSVAFSPDGGLLATAGVPRTPSYGMEADRTLMVWDVVSGAVAQTYSAHAGGGKAVIWNPKEQKLFSAGNDGHLKAWPRTPPPESYVLRGHLGAVSRVAYSPDGQRLASVGGPLRQDRPTGSQSGSYVWIWDLALRIPLRVIPVQTEELVTLDWSDDGRFIATCDVEGSLQVFSPTDGQVVFSTGSREESAEVLTFVAGGDILVNSDGRELIFRQTDDWGELQRWALNGRPISLDVGPDNRLLAPATEEGIVHFRTLEGGEIHAPIVAGSELKGAWFSPDGLTLATAHAGGRIALWNIETGELLRELIGPRRSVQWLDFSPDGRRLVSCAIGMTMRIWDTKTGTEVLALPAHAAPLTSVQFSPDGSAIATSAIDGLVKIWPSENLSGSVKPVIIRD